MHKPSYKSLEGQSLIGIATSCIAFLYMVLAGGDEVSIDPEKIMATAESAKDIAIAYKQDASAWSETMGLGKIGAILFFLYKVYGKFTDSRTEIKKKEIEKNEPVYEVLEANYAPGNALKEG